MFKDQCKDPAAIFYIYNTSQNAFKKHNVLQNLTNEYISHP